LEHHCEEADVRDRRSFNAVAAPIGSSPSEASASNVTPADDDAGLLALEMQFNCMVAELRAIEALKTSQETGCEPEAGAYDVEIILARLYPGNHANASTHDRGFRSQSASCGLRDGPSTGKYLLIESIGTHELFDF
jgi:hypothetical protein